MGQPNKCPVCQSDSVTGFLKRKRVPVHQNLVIDDYHSALQILRGTLSLEVCEECGFIYNQAFNPANLRYGEDYDNTQSFSPAFEEYLTNLARHLILERGVQNCRVIEVGCGKGLFLRKLVAMGENTGYGFDPSYVGPAAPLEGRLYFENRYYGPEYADLSADVIICRHVIEHVPNPLELMHTIRKALVSSARPKIFFETPDVEWILRNQVIWDFFYEHCSYFTAASLTTAFQAAGFTVESIRAVFGGQYLWLEGTCSFAPEHEPAVTKRPGCVPHLAKHFSELESDLKRIWEAKIQEIASRGKVALWGAGAKGVTFANLIDPHRQWITCVVDLNPRKQGRYLPGTGHPIVSYQELPKYGVTAALLMNPNYLDENLGLLRKARIDICFLDPMEWVRGDHEVDH